MFLSDPEHTPYDVKFTLFGFPVRIHPFFWVIAVILSQNAGGPQEMILWILAIVVSLLVHELGHACAFKLYGIYSYITLFTFGGVCVPTPSYGGYRLRTRDDVLISFAGVGFQLILIFLITCLYAVRNSAGIPISFTPEYLWQLLWPINGASSEMFWGFGRFPDMFLRILYFINILWITINIIPVFPLDGGQIVRKILMRFLPHRGFFITLVISIVCAGALAIHFVNQGNWWNAILFGMLAYSNIQMLSPREYY